MMEIVVSHDSVGAVIFLGMGIQGNLARMEREGPFYPDGGLERIVEYHERQEERFAQAAADLSTRMRKPILTATELSITDPATAGPRRAPAVGSATPRPTGRHGVGAPVALRPLAAAPGTVARAGVTL